MDKLASKKRFGFVDGLSGLFLPKQKPGNRIGETLLSDSSLESVTLEVGKALHALQNDGGDVVLVIDQLDLLLAAGGDQITAVGIADTLLRLREVRRLSCPS